MPHSSIRNMARMQGYGTELEKGIDRKVLRRAWKFGRAYRTRLILNILVIAASSALVTLQPLVIREMIDKGIPKHNLGLINLLFIALLLLAFGGTALGLANRWFSSNISEGLIYDLRVKLYEHVERMPIGFFTRTQTGSLLSRLNNDVSGAEGTITTASSFASDLFALTTTLVAMLALSWKVTLLALVVVPFAIYLDRKLGVRLATLSRVRMSANAEMTTNMQERFNVSGALLVKLFGRPKEEVAQFSARANDVRTATIQAAVTGRIYFGALALVAGIGTACVYWLGARAVVNGSLTLGTLTALAVYVARLYDPLTSIASARVDLLTALVSFERCFEVLDAPIGLTEKSDAKTLTNPTGKLELKDVWYRYPAPNSVRIGSLETVASNAEHEDQPSDWILSGVNLSAEPGQIVALVGPSGAGKTTLSSLIPRLFDVDKGAVLLDGNDVRDLTLQSVTDAIGVVSQDTHMFHNSVLANLRYAKPTATGEEIVAACKAARIDHVIAAMPDGYNTIVGERGHRLSGGEKQRLAIARVLLKQPAIVVLDEATAHLDSETEALVQEALGHALTGRTAVVIAHRLSTIRAADKIVVLDAGRVVQEGTHTELLEAGGLYKELHDTQFAAQA